MYVKLESSLPHKKDPSQSNFLHLQDHIKKRYQNKKQCSCLHNSLLCREIPESRYGLFHRLSKTTVEKKLLICALGRNPSLPFLSLAIPIIVAGVGLAAYFLK